MQNRLSGLRGASQCGHVLMSAEPHDPQKRETSRFSAPHPVQRNLIPWAGRPGGYQVSLSYVSSTSPLDCSTLAVARMIRNRMPRS